MNTVKLSNKHMRVINAALEVYYRMRSGQIGIALDEAYYDKRLSYEFRDNIQDQIRSVTHPELGPNASYGFNSPQIKDARICYEIKKTFEEFLAVTINDGYYGATVDFDGPLKASDEPLPEVVGFKKYKDFPLPARAKKSFLKAMEAKDYKKAWGIVDKHLPNVPMGSSRSLIVEEDFCGVRVDRPYKDRSLTVGVIP